MPDSDIIISNSGDNYKSLAFLFKKDIFAYHDSVSFCQFPSFKLLILYRKKNCSVNEFLHALAYIMQSKKPDIILGDFNENCLQKNNICPRLQSEGFKQIFRANSHKRVIIRSYIH